ncbi:MAG: alpha,alpha-trehalose phosphorylase [Solirubrobacteraceae bacterium]|jgi:alpha,alpha-trehalose phosphorylase|nr:alpha,alpha-trehalose phosphorylase [Solirubrobacteraceae bacterium]
MIDHPEFAVEPWQLRETQLNIDLLAQTESVFTLANGHLGLRGNLDEGEPHALPGTYLNGFYESRPLPYAEAGYGYPEAGESVVNVTNGKIIRLLAGDEPFDLRYGDLRHHERTLDFRAGVLRRELVWCSPTGRALKITSTRLVSFTQRAVAAIQFEVEPLDATTRLVIQSELVANEPGPPAAKDPRAAAALASPLQSEEQMASGTRGVLVHSTRASALRIAVAMDHIVEGPSGTDHADVDIWDDLARLTVASTVEPGQRLRIVKFLAYGWSSDRSIPAVRDQVGAALAEARHTGWDGLLAEQRAYLDEFWAGADVELDGDAELQQAVRFALFHTLQAGARVDGRAIAAKGLTGPGYDGHCFWDTESFVLPVLTYTAPTAVAHALRWRHRTLPTARERATQLGLRGAAFPWRTITGRECSAYWPAGTAAFHIGADVADAVLRYQAATGDDAFAHEVGTELLVETARLWRSLGHHDPHGHFHIDGVTGPDEYSSIADNNVYTNLMARRNLQGAADAVERHPARAAELGVDAEEAASWRDAAIGMVVPYDADLGIHPQAEGFTRHAIWDFAHTRPDQYPLLLNFPYFDLYRKQVIKQADLVLALFACGDSFTPEEKARNFVYYEQLTVRDSSLSACIQAVVAAEVGALELAYDYFGEAALMDIGDLEHNTADGLHIASLAGAWIAAVAGFGGMRDHGGQLSFAPQLPERLTRLSFRVGFRGSRLRVEVGDTLTSYSLLDGPPLEIRHFGAPVTVGHETRTFPATRIPPGVTPVQPRGRAPVRRGQRP